MQKNILLVLVSLLILISFTPDQSFKKTKSGLLYKIIPAASAGLKIRPGMVVKFQAKVKLKDSITYNSYGKVPAFASIDSTARTYDLSEILPLMKVGDSAVIIQYADTLMRLNGGEMPAGLKQGDRITIHIRILKSYSDIATAEKDYTRELDLQKQREQKVLAAYLNKRKIKAIKTAGGTFVEILSVGTGPLPDSGKEVEVMYSGYHLDGKIFDSNIDTSFFHTDPLKVVLNTGSTIPGFEDGIKQVGLGGKLKLYVPSMMAYGMQGSPPLINPYESLMFYIEVKAIRNAPQVDTSYMAPLQVDTSAAHPIF